MPIGPRAAGRIRIGCAVLCPSGTGLLRWPWGGGYHGLLGLSGGGWLNKVLFGGGGGQGGQSCAGLCPGAEGGGCGGCVPPAVPGVLSGRGMNLLGPSPPSTCGGSGPGIPQNPPKIPPPQIKVPKNPPNPPPKILKSKKTPKAPPPTNASQTLTEQRPVPKPPNNAQPTPTWGGGGGQREYSHGAHTVPRHLNNCPWTWSTGRGAVDGTCWAVKRYHSPSLALNGGCYFSMGPGGCNWGASTTGCM